LILLKIIAFCRFSMVIAILKKGYLSWRVDLLTEGGQE
jgi:hypothetical protein